VGVAALPLSMVCHPAIAARTEGEPFVGVGATGGAEKNPRFARLPF